MSPKCYDVCLVSATMSLFKLRAVAAAEGKNRGKNTDAATREFIVDVQLRTI